MAADSSKRVVFGHEEKLQYEFTKSHPWHDRYLLKKGPRRSREPFALSSTWKNRAEEEEKEKPEHRRRRRAATLKAEREEVDEPPPPPTEGSDSRGVWGKKITFRRAVNTIVTGQRIHNEITGRFKGRLLSYCHLPAELAVDLANQLGWRLSSPGSLSDSLLGSVSDGAKRAMPSLSRGADKYLEGFPTAQNHPPTDEPADIAGDKQVGDGDELELEEEGVGDDDKQIICESDDYKVREEASLRSAFLGFNCRMAALQDSDVEELTSSLMAGLKSWLSMGLAMAPMSGLMLESSEDAASTMAESKMARLMARTQHAADFRREGGINTASADDALATMAEEQAHRISSEFCMWLRNLPSGEDQTVNSLPQDYVRALFDTAQSANVAHSKLAEGLQSWATFAGVSTPRRQASIAPNAPLLAKMCPVVANVASVQVSKNKFRTKFAVKKRNKGKKKKGKTATDKGGGMVTLKAVPAVNGGGGGASEFGSAKHAAAERMERRGQYASGIWYKHPRHWGERFVRMTEEKAALPTAQVEATLASTIPAHQRPLVSSMERSGVGDILCLTGSTSSDGGGGGAGGNHKVLAIAQRKAEAAARREEENKRLSQLDSTLAFAEFLRQRKNYTPPDFLKDLLS